MSDEDKMRLLEEKITRIDEEIKRGHTDLINLHADRVKIFEKLEENQKKIIGNEKDIMHSKETFLTKIEDIKNDQTRDFEKLRQDVNALWKSFRGFKDEIKKDMKDEFSSVKDLISEQIENKSLGNRLWMSIAAISVLTNIIIILLSKFGG